MGVDSQHSVGVLWRSPFETILCFMPIVYLFLIVSCPLCACFWLFHPHYVPAFHPHYVPAFDCFMRIMCLFLIVSRLLCACFWLFHVHCVSVFDCFVPIMCLFLTVSCPLYACFFYCFTSIMCLFSNRGLGSDVQKRKGTEVLLRTVRCDGSWHSQGLFVEVGNPPPSSPPPMLLDWNITGWGSGKDQIKKIHSILPCASTNLCTPLGLDLY